MELASSTEDISPRALEVAHWLRDYAARLDLSLYDERRALPPHVFLDFARAGLFGVQGEAQWGGLEFGPTDCFHIAEQFGAIDLTLSIGILLQSFLATPPIRSYGSASLKARYLPDLVSGRILASYCLTETVAGSDPRRIQATAKQQNNGSWLLNGEKIWSGNAASAQLMVVFAKTFDNTGRELGISAFAVDRSTPGITQGREARTMGLRGMVQNSISFRQAIIPAEHLLGKPGEGLKIGGETMAFARLVIGAICLGTMKRCLHLAVSYAKQRRIGSGPMAQNPTTLSFLEVYWSEALALEALVTFAAHELEAGRTLGDEFYAAIKVLALEMLWRVTDGCLQLLGGRGYLENNVIARILRDARVLRIFEGPTETLAVYLGARIWKDIEPFLALLRALGGHTLMEPLQSLVQATQFQVAHAQSEKQRPLTLRAHYLIGKFAAEALKVAALAQHSKATTPMMEYALRRWTMEHELSSAQSANLAGISLTAEISEFCGPVGQITAFFAGEEWMMDPFLALTSGKE